MMNELHLFAGAGGGILGGMLLGHTTVCAVEIEPYCRRVLLQRQRDGILPKFPIWDDVCTFDGNPWRGKVDVVCGGFPCQDISCAGKGAGLSGERSGLWGEFSRIIGEIRPHFAFVENSPMLTLRGLDRVLGNLTEMGYDNRWGVVSASDTGAPHLRERIWILARRNKNFPYTKHNGVGRGEQLSKSTQEKVQCLAYSELRGCQEQRRKMPSSIPSNGSWWKSEPTVGRVANGVANRVGRLKAIGNGQVPRVAATSFRLLSESVTK